MDKEEMSFEDFLLNVGYEKKGKDLKTNQYIAPPKQLSTMGALEYYYYNPINQHQIIWGLDYVGVPPTLITLPSIKYGNRTAKGNTKNLAIMILKECKYQDILHAIISKTPLSVSKEIFNLLVKC